MPVGTNEKILLNYLPEIEYNNDALNTIGASTSILRTAETTDVLTTHFVRKFGAPYLIKSVSVIDDPVDVNATWSVYALDGTLLAHRTGGDPTTSVDGSVDPAQGCYLDIDTNGGAASLPATITIDTDVDSGPGLAFNTITETVLANTNLRLYLSDTTSTYYDAAMMRGGKRHVPVPGDSRLPYFDISTAYAALAGAFKIVHVVDSETYDEQLDLNVITSFLQAAVGQAPTITSGIGSRVTREVTTQYHNANAIYFNEHGDDADNGKWLTPKLTIAGAIAGRGAKDVIYGGTGASVANGEFTAGVVIAANFTLEADYGYTPSISIGAGINPSVHIQSTAANIHGWIITANFLSNDVILANNAGGYSGTLQDNTISRGTDNCIHISTGAFTGTIDSCEISNATDHGIQIDMIGASSGIIRKSLIHSNNNNGIYINSGAVTSTLLIQNNVIYDNDRGIDILLNGGFTFNGTIEKTTIFNNSSYGIFVNFSAGAENGTYQDLVIWGNGINDIASQAGTPTITISNYGTNNNWIIGANNITTDPEFCKTTFPYQLGLSANSGALHTGTNNEDMGANLRIVEINNNDITVNGFNIDGQDQYNNGIFIADAVNHTGAIVITNSIFSFDGIAVDPYDDDTATSATISNNQIFNNGNGIKLTAGSNILEENLIYNNTIYAIFIEDTMDSLVHNVLTGNQYGTYLESTASSTIIRDNIYSKNSKNDIFSETTIAVTFNSFDGALSSNVEALADTNILTSPLFIDFAANNYNIKTIESGSSVDSQCKDAASDGQDIGGWNLSRSVEDESWKKYRLAWNPRKLDPEYNGKGVSKFENALGITKIFEKGHLRIYPFQWDRTQASTEELWKKIQYLSSLVPDRDQGRTADQCRIRVHPLPDQLLLSGSGVISAATKTIQDVALDLTEDELKGYWASIKYLEGDGSGSLVFYIGNEIDLSEWTTLTVNGAGSITHAIPGLDGTSGKIKATLPGAEAVSYYAKKSAVFPESSVMVSAYLDISALVMADGDSFDTLTLQGPAAVPIFIKVDRHGTDYQVKLTALNDAAGSTTTSLYNINKNSANLIQFVLKQAATSVSSDGSASLYINGSFKEKLSGIDNFDIYAAMDQMRSLITGALDVGTSGDLCEDEYYVVQGNKMFIDSTNNIGIVPSANWTTNEHRGKYMHIDGYYCLIKANGESHIEISNPNSTLVTQVLNWAFEKYFKMIKTERDILHLEDENSELPTGTLNYYCDFIEMHVVKPTFKTLQERFYWLQETWKTGFNLFLEEL